MLTKIRTEGHLYQLHAEMFLSTFDVNNIDMISITGVTNAYILQPVLQEKHNKTLEWLSATMLWKNELAFFQKAIEQKSKLVLKESDKHKLDHFQNLILYYGSELIMDLRSKLRDHENRLARILETKSEWDIQYFKEHDALMEEATGISKGQAQLREELVTWVSSLA